MIVEETMSQVSRLVPICDDGVCNGVVWIIVGCSYAGLEEDLRVLDWSDGLNLHVDHLTHIILQRVCACINSGVKTLGVIKLKLIAE